jgi:protection of telomeres protein 1
MWSGYVSLISNFRSEIDVYAAKTMPSWPLKPSGAILKKPSTKSGLISPAESSYAAWLFSRFDRRYLPASKEFEESVRRAGNIKDKYSLLKDVQIARFYDMIGEVIRIYDRDGVVTMHISDYTAHSLFFNYAYDGVKGQSNGRDDDEFGYIRLKRNVENMWPGPYGKLSLQLTAYDAHADFIRANVKVTDWVLLKNVHIRMGKSGCCIEGILHGDKDACEGKVQVQIIHPSKDAEMHDTRWKEAVRRKRDYWSKFKRQKQDLEDTTNSNGKRNSAAETAQNQNSKKRRKEKRAAAEARAAVFGQKLDGCLGLNANGIYTVLHLGHLLISSSRMQLP